MICWKGGAFIAVSDRNSRTPLHVTALEGKSEMAQLLILKGADKGASDGQGVRRFTMPSLAVM